jgi:hypothetical protein
LCCRLGEQVCQYLLAAQFFLQTNKLAEQSDKISKLEHKTTEQVLTIKEQYAEINVLYNKVHI